MATYKQIQEYVRNKGYAIKTCWIASMKEE